MLSRCCIRVVKEDFEKNNIIVDEIKIGFACVSYSSKSVDIKLIDKILLQKSNDYTKHIYLLIVEQNVRARW